MDTSPVLGTRPPPPVGARSPQVLAAAADEGEEPQRRSLLPPKGPSVPMALRVTRATARTTPTDPRAAATSALAREDLAAYRSLFAATGQEDFHARYAARRALLEAGLTGPARETPNAVAQRFATV